jgi:hypothetical protein
MDEKEISRRKKISDTMKKRGLKPPILPIEKNKRMTGKTPWNKGKELTEIHKLKLKQKKIEYKPTFGGKHHNGWKNVPKNIREKISNKLLGHENFNKELKGCFKKGHIPITFNNYSSFELYGKEFNKNLKEQIRKRDNYTCQECGVSQIILKSKLSVHHIDFNKRNNHPENLISLCVSCHTKTQFDKRKWIKYYQNKMKGGGLNGRKSKI